METGNKRVNPVVWDNNICHEYWFVYHGQGNVAKNIWDGPNPPGPPPGQGFVPPPPIPPGWCWGCSFRPRAPSNSRDGYHSSIERVNTSARSSSVTGLGQVARSRCCFIVPPTRSGISLSR